MYKVKKMNGFCIGFVNKSVHKSVRLAPSVYDYIMSFDGRNFSDKLENLVISHASLDEYLRRG